VPKPWLWKVIIQADNNYIKNPVRTFNCVVSHDAVSRVLSGCWTRDTDGDDRCQSAAEMAQFRVSWLNRRSFPTIIMSNCRNNLSAFCSSVAIKRRRRLHQPSWRRIVADSLYHDRKSSPTYGPSWSSRAICDFRAIRNTEEWTLNPLECRGNYIVTSNNMKLVHWPLMGAWLLHLVQRARMGLGGAPARPGSSSLYQM